MRTGRHKSERTQLRRPSLTLGVMSRYERARHEHRKPHPAACRRASSTFIGALKTMALSVCACGGGVVVRGVRGAFVKWRSAFVFGPPPDPSRTRTTNARAFVRAPHRPRTHGISTHSRPYAYVLLFCAVQRCWLGCGAAGSPFNARQRPCTAPQSTQKLANIHRSLQISTSGALCAARTLLRLPAKAPIATHRPAVRWHKAHGACRALARPSN